MKTTNHLLALAIFSVAAAAASAASIPVDEHSFEGAKTIGGWTGGGAASGQSTGSVPAPWVKTGTGFGSEWTSPSQYTAGIPDGDIYAYANSGTNISQTLAATLQADTTYTLTVGVGWRADLPGLGFPNFPGYGIELWAGGVKLASTYSTNQGGAGATPTGDQWIDAVATYTSPASVTADALQIRLIGYGIQTNYDNVRLDAARIETTPAMLASTAPADGATGVLVISDVVATFDESIALTGAGTVTIRNLGPGPDVVIDLSGPDPDGSVSVTGPVLTISPASHLVAGTPYAIQISADAIVDLAIPPNAFAGILDDTTWNFQTGSYISLPVSEHSFEGAKTIGGWTGGGAASGQSSGSVPAPWVKTGTGFGSGWTSPSQYTASIPDGDIYAYANGGTNISQTLSTTLQADTTYTLTVGIGWRADLPGIGFPNFPGYGIELWAGGVKLASTYSTNQGGTGASPNGDQWIDAVATYTSPASVTADALQIRLIGYGIQTNYDNVRLTAVPATGFTTWIAGFDVGGQTGIDDDPDRDGIPNGVENFFGTEPDAFSHGLVAAAYHAGARTFTFTHPQGTLASDLAKAYQWSKDLTTFHADGGTDGAGTSVAFTVDPDTPSPGTTTVTATVTGAAASKLFVRVRVTQD